MLGHAQSCRPETKGRGVKPEQVLGLLLLRCRGQESVDIDQPEETFGISHAWRQQSGEICLLRGNW